MYADVGAERPADLPHNVRRAQPAAYPQVEGEDDLVQNLEALTRGIPDYGRLADVPLTCFRRRLEWSPGLIAINS